MERDDSNSNLGRRNAHLKWGLGVILLAWAARETVPRAEAAPSARLEAREFRLVDAHGRRTATLGIGDDGRAELVFYDSDGQRTITISDRTQAIPLH